MKIHRITLTIISVYINSSLVLCPTLQAMEAPPAYAEEDAKLKHAHNFAITGELLPAVVSFKHFSEGDYTFENISHGDKINIETSKNPCDKFLCFTSAWFKKIHFEALEKHEPDNPKIVAGLKLTPRVLLNITTKDRYFMEPKKALALVGGEVRPQELAVFTLTDGSTQYILNDNDKAALQQLTYEQRQFIQNLALRDSASESILNDAEWKILNTLPEVMSKLLKLNLNLRPQAEIERKIKSEIAILEEARAQLAKETEVLEKRHEALYADYQAKLAQHSQAMQRTSNSFINSMQEGQQAFERAKPYLLHSKEPQLIQDMQDLQQIQGTHAAQLETVLKQIKTNRNVLFGMISLGVLAGSIWLIKYWMEN